MSRLSVKSVCASALLCWSASLPVAGQTHLAAGDVAIIQYRTSGGDSFSFVTLKDLVAGTPIHFTDKGWTGSGFPRPENVWTWTAPAGGVPRGHVVQMDVREGLNNGRGDQIIAFQGTVARPRFLYAVNTHPWLTEGPIGRSTSHLPFGLVNGVTARDFSAHEKHGSFNIVRVSGSPAEISCAVADPAHWNRSHDGKAHFRPASAWTFDVLQPPPKEVQLQVAPATTPRIWVEREGAGHLSGMIDDPTDPAATRGLDFRIVGARRRRVQVTASNAPHPGTPYAPPELQLVGRGATRKLLIRPTGTGFSHVTVLATDGVYSNTYELLYASTTRPPSTQRRCQHTHASDASAVVSAGPRHMLVADDEDQTIRLYERYRSGGPLATFELNSYLNLTNINDGVPREVDIEAAAVVGPRVYWIGSHGNSRLGEARPNRRRIFSTDRYGQGVKTKLKFIGHYEGFREDLLNWDRNGAHGFGENYLGFSASSRAADAGGIEPKRIDGFNIEALAMQPGSKEAMYVGFRAPLVPAHDRRYALVIPVSNMASMVDNSAPVGSAQFGAPVFLDLEGRGIRSMARKGSNTYVIVAGPQKSSIDPANDFKIYTWSGQPDSPPRACEVDLTEAGLLGAIEGVLDTPNGEDASVCHVVLDQGSKDWYGDGMAAKIHVGPLRQFTSGLIHLSLEPSLSVEVAQGESH